jgi:hypothetical protein
VETFTHRDLTRCLDRAYKTYDRDPRMLDAIVELRYMLATYEHEVCTVLPGSDRSRSIATWRELYRINNTRMGKASQERMAYAKQTKVQFAASDLVIELKKDLHE